VTDRRRGWGAAGWWGGVGFLLFAAGCQRVGLPSPGDGPWPPSGPPAVLQPSLPELEGGDPGAARVLERDPLRWEGLDPILHSVVARDPAVQERVDFWVGYWTGRGSGHFSRYLERMAVYEGVVSRELADRGLPPSLRFLPVVESGYHHSIVSRAGATGLWQLMPPTARDLGLSVTSLVDDRRDPLSSTRAALDYLQQLYRMFGSWPLALSAYNAGPGRIRRIVGDPASLSDRVPDEVFLEFRSRFPAETRDFVPRFFAAALLASNPADYGFQIPQGIQPMAFDEVRVPDATSLDVVARAAGVSEEEIRGLNPHYLRGFTPPGQARTLRVPPGRGELFQVNYAMIPPNERVSFVEHVVARGETLSQIARRYGVAVADLSSSNGNVEPRRLQIGQRLLIPMGAGTGQATFASSPPPPAESSPPEPARAAAVATAPTSSSSSPASAPVANLPSSPAARAEAAPRRHRVSSGDTLWGVAQRYGVTLSDLQRWNGISPSAVLRPGQELVVVPGEARHRVARGDTWGGLAQRYGVPTSELARANGRSPQDIIRVGETLRIP